MKLDVKKIKIEMAKKEWNQKQLAEAAGINRATLSFMLSKKRQGYIDTWEKIAKALDVNVVELIEREE